MASTYELISAAAGLLYAIDEAEENADEAATLAAYAALDAWMDSDVPGKLAALDGAKRGILADAERAKAEATQWTDRRRRLEARADRVAGMSLALLQARLQVTGEDVCKLPDGRKAKVRDYGRATVRVDEDLLPAEYWRITRSPNLAAVGAALKTGESVPGATTERSEILRVDIR